MFTSFTSIWEIVSVETQLIWVETSSHFDQTRLNSHASYKIHELEEIYCKKKWQKKETFFFSFWSALQRRWFSFQVILLSTYFYFYLLDILRPIYISVVQIASGEPRWTAWHYTWRHPTRGPWGQGSLFLLYWLGIVCHSSWSRHALPTWHFQSRAATVYCFPLSGWPCDLREIRNAVRQTRDL